MKKSAKTRLIIMAHPDDPELSCGGTIAQWTAEGDTVYYIIVSCGEKGTWEKDTSPFRVAEVREQEALKAAQFLGVKKVIFLRHPDGNVDLASTLRLELAALIRHLKPHTVVTHDPWRKHFHPDHRATGFAVIKAIMISRDWHFFPFLTEIGLPTHRSKELLFSPSDTPTFIVDVSGTFEQKLEAIGMHKSQLDQLPDWEERISEFARKVGSSEGYEYGEGFFQMRV
jgi:LmbE family N-acetylglucosaminyl deacetylase